MAKYYPTVSDDGVDILCREDQGKLTHVELSEKHAARIQRILEKYDEEDPEAQSKFQTIYLFMMATGASIKVA